MWIDDTGAAHTIWVRPEAILGAEAVAALQAVPADVRAAAVADLDHAYDRILDEAVAAAPTGPTDVEDPDDHDQPPLVPGLAPRPGESLGTTVLAHLDRVPPQWRVEALEAVVEVIDDT